MGLGWEGMLGEYICMLLFWAGTIRKLHVEDISQVLRAQSELRGMLVREREQREECH